jgi:hypothetical protein
MPALSPFHAHCRSEGCSLNKDVAVVLEAQACDGLGDEAQSRVQTLREDCTVVRRQKSPIKTIQLPDMRNIMHKL